METDEFVARMDAGEPVQDQDGITLGDDALIGHNVVIATLDHDLGPETRATTVPRPVVVGDRVWIGANATILPGVTIGDGDDARDRAAAPRQ